MVFQLLAALALVGILVFIHESGHFIFAKIFGVGVQVFSLGFGRRLFGVEWGGTDYRVSLIPAGGYVMMEGADPFQDGGDGDTASDSPTSFMNKPVWQRLIIVAAGPAFNLLLPVVVFTALFMVGEPGAAPVLGQVDLYSSAQDAGLQVGDRVTHINGKEIATWGALEESLEHIDQDPVVRLLRGEQSLELTLDTPQGAILDGGVYPSSVYGISAIFPGPYVVVSDSDSVLAQAGLETGDLVTKVGEEEIRSFDALISELDGIQGEAEVAYMRRDTQGDVVDGSITVTQDPTRPESSLPFEHTHANAWGLAPPYLSVYEVQPESPAEIGGLLRGDVVTAVDGVKVRTFNDVIHLVKQAQVGEGEVASARSVTLTLLRDGELQDRIFKPTIREDHDNFGRYTFRPVIGFNTFSVGIAQEEATRRYNFVPALQHAGQRTLDAATKVISTVGYLVTGEAAASKTVGGPIAIFRHAAAAAERGIFDWAYMMAGLSISLAVVNFLPVPVLDGGQFLFYAVEGIRGRPLSLLVRERAQQVGVLFLLGLMFVVLVIDVRNWIAA